MQHLRLLKPLTRTSFYGIIMLDAGSEAADDKDESKEGESINSDNGEETLKDKDESKEATQTYGGEKRRQQEWHELGIEHWACSLHQEARTNFTHGSFSIKKINVQS
jgi:hypothetical protein